MAFYRCGGGGIPSSLKTDMNAVLNKKFGTSSDYPPAGWPDTVNLMGPLPEKTIVSSPIAHITDGADEVPIKSWKVEIAPTLTGKSAIEATQTGKNLLNAQLEQGQYGSNGGYSAGSNRICIRKENSFTLPVGTHTLSIDGLDTCTVLFFTADGSAVADNRYATSWHNLPFTFAVSNSDYIVVFTARKSDNSNISPSDYEAQIEAGSTATTYEPYTAPTVSTVNLGRTIYGGTADVVNGTGTDENGNDFTFTPITPTPETALGVNNFWADEGDSEVTYRADIDLALGGQ